MQSIIVSITLCSVKSSGNRQVSYAQMRILQICQQLRIQPLLTRWKSVCPQSSLVEGDEGCISPSGKLQCLLQIEKLCSTCMASFHRCLNIGPMLLCKRPFHRSVTFILYFVSRLLTAPSFCSLLFATIYIIFWPILPKNVPDYSSLCDILLAYYIQFENVHCHYINLIDSKYSISPLKSFGLLCCHYSQKSSSSSPST